MKYRLCICGIWENRSLNEKKDHIPSAVIINLMEEFHTLGTSVQQTFCFTYLLQPSFKTKVKQGGWSCARTVFRRLYVTAEWDKTTGGTNWMIHCFLNTPGTKNKKTDTDSWLSCRWSLAGSSWADYYSCSEEAEGEEEDEEEKEGWQQQNDRSIRCMHKLSSTSSACTSFLQHPGSRAFNTRSGFRMHASNCSCAAYVWCITCTSTTWLAVSWLLLSLHATMCRQLHTDTQPAPTSKSNYMSLASLAEIIHTRQGIPLSSQQMN